MQGTRNYPEQQILAIAGSKVGLLHLGLRQAE
jgi:hypothetical protein